MQEVSLIRNALNYLHFQVTILMMLSWCLLSLFNKRLSCHIISLISISNNTTKSHFSTIVFYFNRCPFPVISLVCSTSCFGDQLKCPKYLQPMYGTIRTKKYLYSGLVGWSSLDHLYPDSSCKIYRQNNCMTHISMSDVKYN